MYICQSQSPSSFHLPFPLGTHMIVLYVRVFVYDFPVFYDYCLAPGSRALFVNRNPGHKIQIQSIQSVCSGAVVQIKQNEENTGLSLMHTHTHTHTHTHDQELQLYGESAGSLDRSLALSGIFFLLGAEN